VVLGVPDPTEAQGLGMSGEHNGRLQAFTNGALAFNDGEVQNRKRRDHASRLRSAPMIVVIGAGMAGLVAGRVLHDAGQQVVVVEGRDRIGGRTHTVDVGGASIDLGGSWIHDGAASPMLPYVESLGIERLGAAPSSIVLGAAVLDRRLGQFADAGARMALSVAMASFMLSHDRHDSLATGLTLAESVDALIPETDGSARRTMAALLAMYEGADADEVKFDNFAPFFFSGEAKDSDVLPDGGYRRVTHALAVGLDIRLSTPVVRIEHGGGGVVVHTSEGALDATSAIVTVPLGVLKAGSIVFDPPLPPAHQAAIDRVGFGAFEKVALAYPEAVWQVEGAPTHITAIDGQSVEWPVILDMSTWYGTPVVLGMAVGGSAHALSRMSDDDKVGALHEVIVAIGGANTPPPTASAVTGWTADPFLCGCYTRIDAASDPATQAADVATLATPIGPLLLAGEHTNVSGTSTVDSAWLSGLRAAGQILGADVTLP
jgi:monoamine oxidase